MSQIRCIWVLAILGAIQLYFYINVTYWSWLRQLWAWLVKKKKKRWWKTTVLVRVRLHLYTSVSLSGLSVSRGQHLSKEVRVYLLVYSENVSLISFFFFSIFSPFASRDICSAGAQSSFQFFFIAQIQLLNILLL